jgi:hypothetical protein
MCLTTKRRNTRCIPSSLLGRCTAWRNGANELVRATRIIRRSARTCTESASNNFEHLFGYKFKADGDLRNYCVVVELSIITSRCRDASHVIRTFSSTRAKLKIISNWPSGAEFRAKRSQRSKHSNYVSKGRNENTGTYVITEKLELKCCLITDLLFLLSTKIYFMNSVLNLGLSVGN